MHLETPAEAIQTHSELGLTLNDSGRSSPQPPTDRNEATPSVPLSTRSTRSTVSTQSDFNASEAMPQIPKAVKYFKISLILVLISIIIVALIYHDFALSLLLDYLNWWQNNMLEGMLLYLFVYLSLVVTMVGGSWMTIGGGLVFSQVYGPLIGIPMGAILGWLGQSIGAQITYFNCQYCFREAVLSWTSKRKSFQMIDSLIGIYGFKIAFLLRLSPLTPFGIMNYIMGVTSIKLKSYSLSHIGMLPDSFLMSFIGASIETLVEIATVGIENNIEIFIATIVGTLVTFIGMLYVGYKSKQEFKRMKFEYKQSLKQEILNNHNNDIDNDNGDIELESKTEQTQITQKIDIDDDGDAITIAMTPNSQTQTQMSIDTTTATNTTIATANVQQDVKIDETYQE